MTRVKIADLKTKSLSVDDVDYCIAVRSRVKQIMPERELSQSGPKLAETQPDDGGGAMTKLRHSLILDIDAECDSMPPLRSKNPPDVTSPQPYYYLNFPWKNLTARAV